MDKLPENKVKLMFQLAEPRNLNGDAEEIIYINAVNFRLFKSRDLIDTVRFLDYEYVAKVRIYEKETLNFKREIIKTLYVDGVLLFKDGVYL